MEKLEPCAPCWCGSGKAYKDCHCAFDEKYESLRHPGVHLPPRRLIKNEAQIGEDPPQRQGEHRRVGLCSGAHPPRRFHRGDRPLGLRADRAGRGHPRAAELRGLPQERLHLHQRAGLPRHSFPEDILCEGDIVNVDCSTILDGYYSDSSRMFIIGETTPEKQKLVEVTRQCVQAGLEEVKPWEPIGNVGEAVHSLARKNGYTVVREVGGHGVGVEFHEDPFVSYVTRRGTGMIMAPGMIFTIEPMVNMGTNRIYIDADNDWTIYTQDGKPSAQWEIQVLVTETGHEVLAW